MPRLLLESFVPYVPEEINRYFDVEIVHPDDINPEKLRDFDAMIIRTRTRCNEALLAGTPVQFAATATIGMDHIDIPWCEANGIEVASAPGCNAPAVAQYVYASLLSLFPDSLEGKTIGVVGVGHVGSIVADWGEQLGMKVLRCDPPREEKEGSEKFVTLDQIAEEADIITFHVPRTESGPYPTQHMADDAFFRSLKRRPVIVNAARGPIVDTEALKRAIDCSLVSKTVIDTWEGEPRLDLDLLHKVDIATPHIAGYSIEGKVRAATAVTNALCRHFGVDYRYDPGLPYLPENVTAESIRRSYDPMEDDVVLRANPSNFENLRNEYALRKEVR